MNFVVRIDHLTDKELEFFGWYRTDSGEEFSSYYSPYMGEEQIVANDPPRYLVVDDLNDARAINPEVIIQGPPRSRKS